MMMITQMILMKDYSHYSKIIPIRRNMLLLLLLGNLSIYPKNIKKILSLLVIILSLVENKNNNLHLICIRDQNHLKLLILKHSKCRAHREKSAHYRICKGT